MAVTDAFYLVWKNGGDAPTKRHELIESAREEAKRLAKDNPGMEFFVMRVIEGVTYSENPWRMRNFRKQKETILMGERRLLLWDIADHPAYAWVAEVKPEGMTTYGWRMRVDMSPKEIQTADRDTAIHGKAWGM